MRLKEFILLVILIALDLITKAYFQANLAVGESIVIIDGFFNFTYAINTGAAWSMLEGKMLFFYLVTIVVCIVLLYILIKNKHASGLERFSVVLMLAGAVGNFYDRLTFEYVRDFLQFNIFGYNFPIFNLADTFLCVGVLLLFIAWFILDKKEKNDAQV